MNKLILPLSLLLGFALGWFIKSPDSDPQPNSIAVSEEGAVPTGTTDSNGASPDVTEAVAGIALDSMSFEQKLARIESLKATRSMANTIETLMLISSMNEQELSQTIQSYSEKGMSTIDDFLMPYYLFVSWVEKSPEGAYAFYQNEASGGQKHMYAQSLFSAWAARDLEGAVAAAQTLESENEKAMAMSAIAMSVAGKDPGAAYDMLVALPDTNSWMIQNLFVTWGAQDRMGAMAKINEMDHGEMRTRALSGLIAGVARKDARQAADMALSLDSKEEREEAMRSVTQVWLDANMEEGLAFIASIKDGDMRQSVISDAIWSIAREDPERALEFVNTHMTGRQRDGAIRSVISSLSSKDPLKAAAYVATLPYGQTYSDSVRTIANNWGQKDAIAALNWAYSLSEGEEKVNAVQVVLDQFAESKLDQAKLYFMQSNNPEEREILLDSIAGKMARQSPIAGVEWAQSLANENENKIAYAAALNVWVDQDPEEALAYLNAQDDVESVHKFARSIAYQWAQKDLPNAAAWAENLEDENAQSEALSSISTEWLRHNTEEASIWISELKPSKGRDQAVINLVNQVRRSDPEAAFAWAETIENDRNRKNSTRNAINSLKENDPDRARELIRRSDLPVEEKTRLENLLK